MNKQFDLFVKMKIKELSENISRMTYAYINPDTKQPTVVPAKHYKDILDQPVEVMVNDQVKRQFLNIMFNDHDIRWRETELDLCAGSHGEPVIAPGQVLMEIKIPGAAPLWLAHMLSELSLFPTGFSKYGTCYKTALLEKYFNGVISCV